MSTPPAKPHGDPEAPVRLIGGHPVGLYVLFSTELWERFCFYSMRAFLVLYMTKAMLVSQKVSNEIYGAYLGFVYAAPFFGGMLADRLLGQRRAIFIGGILMAIAQFSLAGHALMIDKQPPTESVVAQAAADPAAAAKDAESELKAGAEEAADPHHEHAPVHMLFFAGLALMAAGNGFFKPNISTIVGSLYPQNDARRDGAFTIFYMGINIGALLAGFSGQMAESYGWYIGFLIAGIGMIASLVVMAMGKGLLQGQGLPPDPQALRRPWHFGIPKAGALGVAVIVFIPVAAYMMSHPTYVQSLAVIVAVPILGYLLWEAARSPREEGQRMLVIIVLCCFSMMFWAFFELAGSAINLFADAHVNRQFFGKELGASLLTASINPAFIILMAFPFAKLWVWLNKKNAEPSSPLKFALGLMQLAAGFFLMYLGAVQAGTTGRCNITYLVLGFFLHTSGELCLSPVGLSTITKLSPARLVGTFMGVWFLASALGNVFGGLIGGFTENAGFDTVFKWIAITGAAAGGLLLLLTPFLKKMMHGVK